MGATIPQLERFVASAALSTMESGGERVRVNGIYRFMYETLSACK